MESKMLENGKEYCDCPSKTNFLKMKLRCYSSRTLVTYGMELVLEGLFDCV